MCDTPLCPEDQGRCLADFREELMRWNGSMNLLSRKASDEQCQGLIDQCLGAWGLLESWLEDRGLLDSGSDLQYIDLGSGSGFPGVVWSLVLGCGARRHSGLLVEPREKRAWFLKRLNSRWGGRVWDVHRARWGEGTLDGGPIQHRGLILVSLKALHLNDFQVIDGVVKSLGAISSLAGGLCPVVIARFYPPDQVMDEELVGSLGEPTFDPLSPGFSGRAQFRDRHIIGPTKGLLPAGLVVTQIDLIAP